MSFWLVSLTILKNNKSICIGTGLFGDGSQGVMEFFSIKKKICTHIKLWEIVANAVGKCSTHMSVERNTVQND